MKLNTKLILHSHHRNYISVSYHFIKKFTGKLYGQTEWININMMSGMIKLNVNKYLYKCQDVAVFNPIWLWIDSPKQWVKKCDVI